VLQIVSPTKRFFQIVDPLVGIATNFCMILPDARTIRTQTPFVFENASSNFVGIYNADRTTFHRLPPRATLTCTLKTQATASGVWGSMVHDPAVGNPAFGLSVFNDCTGALLTGVQYSDHGLQSAYGVTGSLNILSQSEGGKQGTYYLGTGINAAGYCNSYSALSNSYLGNGCRACEMKQSLYNLSTAAEEFISRFGISDNITGGAPANGVYLLYDRAAYGDVWVMRNINGAGNNTVPTAVAPKTGSTGSDWQKLRVEVDSAASRSDFWIDNVLMSPAGGLNTRVPLAATAIKHLNICLTKTVGITARYWQMDNYRIQSYPITPR
jgi:hypothetical protein